jgi:multidrug efflux system membrane fusion protein
VRSKRLILLAMLCALPIGLMAEQKIRAAAAAASNSTSEDRSNRPLPANAGQAATAVVTAVAASRDVPVTKNAVGWIESIAVVAIRPRLDGVIVSETVKDGQDVRASDELFKLDDQAIQAGIAKDQAAIEKDQADADQLKTDLERLQTLHSHDDATEQQVEQQQAALNEALASMNGDKAQLAADQVELGYTTIKAPISGRIGVINTNVGAVVHVADLTPLMTITQMAPVRVSFNAPERDLAAYRQALDADAAAPVRVFDANSRQLLSEGKLAFIDSSVDTSSGTITVKAEFENADGALWPGQYVQVESELGTHRDATVAPVAAVQMNKNGSFVFLAKPDGTAAMQPVTVADTSGDLAVFASGLQPGDHVVTEGQLRLKDGSHIVETVPTTENSPTSG